MVNTILMYSFIGIALLLVAAGLLRRAKRAVLWTAAIVAGGAATAAHFDAFWPMAMLGLSVLWMAILGLNTIDSGWCMRFGLTLVSAVLGFLVMWPSLDTMSGGKFPCPAWVEHRIAFRLVSGLDLRGGMRLVYTVDVDEAIKDKRDRYFEDMRVELAKAYGLHSGTERPSEDVYVKLRQLVDIDAPRRPANVLRVTVKPGADPSKIDARLLQIFSGDLSMSRTGDQRSIVFTMKSRSETAIRERAVGQAREIILRRVDELGLREAAVSTRDEDIIVEVPGEDQKAFDSIREIISQTARLEFKLLADDEDFFGPVAKREKGDALPEGLEFLEETPLVGMDEGGEPKSKKTTYAFLRMKLGETSKQALERFKEWVSTLSVTSDREIGFQMMHDVDPDTQKEKEIGWRTYYLKSRAEVTGDMVRDATAQADQDQGGLGGWHVALTFTDQGGRVFDRITTVNVKRRFAIILDGRTESAPTIQTRIPGGHAQITMGSGDPEVQLKDSRKLELVLRSGALPAPISPTNEQRIGPSLGRDAIQLGMRGAAVGIGLVLLFMMAYYKKAGVIANLAVLLNSFLQLAILASFGASMTLPGIAGLALTVGMSVDANVLINERIREELREGKSPRAAVEIGYAKALTAIIDGHVTTLISGVVLAQYGTGPVKGFAVTLLVGVIASLFTAVVVSRVMFDLWVRGWLTRDAKIDIG